MNVVSLALVSMPFVSCRTPSLQLGTLAPVAASTGHHVTTVHALLDFAALIGRDRYEALCDFGRQPLGDWMFSAAAFREEAPDTDAVFLDEHIDSLTPLLHQLGWSAADVRGVRDNLVPAYLDWLIGLIPWRDYNVVGFTSTFQQNLATLALARRIKELAPNVLIIVGGANTEDEMGTELLEVAPWIDLAVVGEGERTLPELLDVIGSGGNPLAVRGVAGRVSGRVVRARARPLLPDLDQLPVPDYDEYFQRARVLRLLDDSELAATRLPVETSRGCWWGQKHHCTFCGLNGSAMTFRAKSPDRAEHELATLAHRYGIRSFAAVDNILDPRYLRSLMVRLAELSDPYNLFYEVKANLGRSDIALLRQAGVREIQPGIESLSSAVLSLMCKGVSAAQNVDILRSCRANGVQVHWNILFGFPGEDPAEYTSQTEWMPALHHLEPPGSVSRLWMERFSPLFRDRSVYPAHLLEPLDGYRFLYPRWTDLRRIAYFFEHDLQRTLPDEAFTGIRAAAAAWQNAWQTQRPWLECERDRNCVLVRDGRNPARPAEYELTGTTAAALAATLMRPITNTGLQTRLPNVPAAELAEAVGCLLERQLIFDDGRFMIGLPIETNTNPARR
ncbi:RiPP maturation radical SAM C-methyltransferase [Nocardia niigatensis]